jgi:hypothetical protein
MPIVSAVMAAKQVQSPRARAPLQRDFRTHLLAHFCEQMLPVKSQLSRVILEAMDTTSMRQPDMRKPRQVGRAAAKPRSFGVAGAPIPFESMRPRVVQGAVLNVVHFWPGLPFLGIMSESARPPVKLAGCFKIPSFYTLHSALNRAIHKGNQRKLTTGKTARESAGERVIL